MGINSYTVVNLIGTATAKTYVVEGPINLTTGTLVPLSGVSLPVTQVEIYGYLSVGANTVPVANAAPAFLSVAGGPPVEQIPAGGQLTYAAPGARFDLKDLSVLGTTGDRVFIKYLS